MLPLKLHYSIWWLTVVTLTLFILSQQHSLTMTIKSLQRLISKFDTYASIRSHGLIVQTRHNHPRLWPDRLEAGQQGTPQYIWGVSCFCMQTSLWIHCGQLLPVQMTRSRSGQPSMPCLHDAPWNNRAAMLPWWRMTKNFASPISATSGLARWGRDP